MRLAEAQRLIVSDWRAVWLRIAEWVCGAAPSPPVAWEPCSFRHYRTENLQGDKARPSHSLTVVVLSRARGERTGLETCSTVPGPSGR